MYTDASDYGIGAYLCQVLPDGQEVPIEFISKTLTKVERRWSTYEKEAYGIFYALRKWEHHLKDIKFTLFTDHKNLTYLTKDPSQKVMRWRLAVQDYDFDIAYIPGEDNIVADAFSRLCPQRLENEQADEASEQALTSISSLLAYEDYIQEWLPKVGSQELDHVQYHLKHEEIASFYAVHAVSTQTGNEPRQYQHIPSDKFDILKRCHNHDIGHWGINRTIELCQEIMEKDPKEKGKTWTTMRADATHFIHSCDTCKKMSEQKLTSHVDRYVTTEHGIMKCLAIDAIHMPKAKSGNSYILTVIDTFTRYTTLYAMKDLTALTAAKVLINHMCVYGVPSKITADNSTEFEKEFREAIEILKTENYKTHPYSHQENGIVERANKEVIRHMRNIKYDLRKQATWDEEVMKVQAILNNKVSEATGLTPNQIIFAGKINLHEGRIYPQPTEKQRMKMSEYMKQQIAFQDELMTFASKKQDETDSKHLYNATSQYRPLNIDTYVVVRHEDEKAPTKLSVRWHGPYRITAAAQRLQGTVYTCYCPTTGKLYDFHASVVQSHPCENDMECVKSRVKDDDSLFIPEAILNHEIKNAKQLNLLIKWVGYKEPEWSGINLELKRMDIVKQYLKNHSLESYGQKRTITDQLAQEPKKKVRFSATCNN